MNITLGQALTCDAAPSLVVFYVYFSSLFPCSTGKPYPFVMTELSCMNLIKLLQASTFTAVRLVTTLTVVFSYNRVIHAEHIFLAYGFYFVEPNCEFRFFSKPNLTRP